MLKNKQAVANEDSLVKIFSIPESENSTLARIEKEISNNLNAFLNKHIVAEKDAPSALESDFMETIIPEDPTFVSDQAEFIINKVVAHSVHTASPTFIGHMTSAIPYFMMTLAKIMYGLNQNLVKIETSKAFTPMERQVIGMLHRQFYKNSEDFYETYTQNKRYLFGEVVSGGTVANLTALWVARNKLLRADKNYRGVAIDGYLEGLIHYNYKKLVVIVSERGHYSIKKAIDLLGLGTSNLILVKTNSKGKIRLDELENEIVRQKNLGNGIMAIVGIAGATETGAVDPLDEMAEIAKKYQVRFHIDAAWGGPTIFSDKYSNLLKGIEKADSIIIDAHKQLYVPVGAGIVLFKNPQDSSFIEHNAKYIVREGSRDLGRFSVEGSRSGIALLIHSALRVLGRKGISLLIDRGIEITKDFAEMIQERENFELITDPELNILTYRYCPEHIRKKLDELPVRQAQRLNKIIGDLNISIQKSQRSSGKTFVSRTNLKSPKDKYEKIWVFRVVLANPLTKHEHLTQVLDEQREIADKLWETKYRSKTSGF